MQKVAKGRKTIDHDFRATWAGKCAECDGSYEAGSVIVKSLKGYQHAVCSPDETEVVTPEPKPIKLSDRSTRCGICTIVIRKTEPIGFIVKQTPQGKRNVPAHNACIDWQHKVRDNKPTDNGGYDVAPSTPTREDIKATTSENRKIERTVLIGGTGPSTGRLIRSSPPAPQAAHKRKPNKAADRLVEIERFRNSN